MADLAEMDLGDDPGEAVDQINIMVTSMKGVTPPAEISADWATLLGVYSAMPDLFAEVIKDPDSAKARGNLTAATERLSDADLVAANANVESWVKTHC